MGMPAEDITEATIEKPAPATEATAPVASPAPQTEPAPKADTV